MTTHQASEPELSRTVKVKALTEDAYIIEADDAERAALAKRFDLSELEALRAEIQLTPENDAVIARGTFSASWRQACAVAGDDFAVTAKDDILIRFVPVRSEPLTPDEEIELAEEDCDEIAFEGDSFDLGEAVAQTLGLSIDPYATGPNADTVRKEKGIIIEGEQDGPLAELLAGLKRD